MTQISVTAEKLRVLLIEQDTAFARYVEEMLGQAHSFFAEVLITGDLETGLAALATQTDVDVVLMDIALPDGAGVANVSLVQYIAPQLPIIVGGQSEEHTVAIETVHAGAKDYISKGHLTPYWLERSIRYAIERNRMDQALMAAAETYHGVFDHLVEGIFRTTPDGRYLMANAALARIYGYDNPEDLMRTLTDIGENLYVERGRRDEFVRLMQENDIITNFESQVYRRDFSVIWISENCRAIRDPKGKLLYYEGTVEDITQQRLAEEKVHHSEALYHSLVETLPQNIFRKDLQFRFTFANQQFCKALGRPLEEIVGKTDFDFFPPELAQKYQQDDRQVIQTGEAYETVEEHQPPGQGKMYVQVVKTPLRDSTGKTLGLQAIFWDITQQRLADEKIRKANSALAASRKELRIRNLQMQEELQMAREIQLTMLPQQYPAFPMPGKNSESAFQFIHRYLPTGSVGGDFFAISALSPTQAAVFLCDVAGHGVRSALITAMVRAIVEELKPQAGSPGEFLSKLNSDLCAILKHTGSPLLTTAFYFVADWETGKMLYANAGHPKPLLMRRSASETVPLKNALGKGQPPLGLTETTAYQTSSVQLSPGDLVVLYTDGLVEVQNTSGELYSQDLLLSAVQRHRAMPAQELFDTLLQEASHFGNSGGFTDDVCLVGMEFLPRE